MGLAALDCVEVVCQALRSHPNDLKVQQYGIAALGNFAFKLDKIKGKIREKGGIELVCDTMQSMRDKEQVLENCFWALGNIIANDTKNQQATLEAGGRDFIMTALRIHNEGADELQKSGSACLRRLEGAEAKP